MTNSGLHPAELIRYTDTNDYACSLCGRKIPTRKTSRNTEVILDWQCVEVAGLFCSELCASRASSDRLYRAKYSFKG
jgi:hypothetical protein